MAGEQILVIEDDDLIADAVCERLQQEGYGTVWADCGEAGNDRLAQGGHDLLLLDNRLPDTTGMEILRSVRADQPELPIVMMTAYSKIEDAVSAMKQGAFHYLVKPFNMEEMLLVIRKALETTRLQREVRLLRRHRRQQSGTDRVLGEDPKIIELLALVEKVVRHGVSSVLIEGESGTGKDLLAKTIHYSGPRASAPYMNITCSALPLHLLESELFGHERGAFTDAKAQKKGLLEVAKGGTVLLDEIGDMPIPLQSKLLRFLEERAFKRIGGTVDLKVDVQIVAATNRDLKEMVSGGTFRNDLYYRLNVIRLVMPPLRERRGDIALLIGFFIDQFNNEFNRQYQGVAPAAMRLLEAHHWPGNVRELRNVLERAFIVGDGNRVRTEDLPIEIREGAVAPSGASRFILPPEGIDLDALGQDMMLQALERTNGNQTSAARLLGMTRDQIKYRLKKVRESQVGSNAHDP